MLRQTKSGPERICSPTPEKLATKEARLAQRAADKAAHEAFLAKQEAAQTKVNCTHKEWTEAEKARRDERRRASHRKWYAANREKAKEKAKRWHDAHPGYRKEQVKEWRAANPEKVKAQRERRSPEKSREASRKWREAHPEKSKASVKASRAKRKAQQS